MFGKRPIASSSEAGLARQPPASLPAAPAAAVSPAAKAATSEGGRTPFPSAGLGAPILGAPAPTRTAAAAPNAPQIPSAVDTRRSDSYYEVKGTIFGALIEAIDLGQLAKLDADSAREEIRDIVNEIIAIKNIVMSISEQEDLLDDICNDVLGYGPLEPLLARDEIADIMVNGSGTVYIEVGGKLQKTAIRFRDNQQLLNICQRIVSQVGRRVDESSPICDARLPDGSRVNAIVPPLAIDGPVLTIRKFRRDKLTLEQLVKFGSISSEGADILKVIGRCRINTLVSGSTGSGKTTLLNCLTRYIDADERIVTCEDAAELQLQQPHVVRLETRPPNLEGEGQVTMRDLVRNCLRMRPERIIVGEVRGPEAFDLLQAMNTGHDGSMGTVHANSPREALSRLESMIMMGGYGLPSRSIREMICSSIDVIVHGSRLRDGSRRITHITEVVGMEGEVIITQDLFLFEIIGEDANGHLIGHHKSTGIGHPKFWDRARYYGEDQRLAAALDAAELTAREVGQMNAYLVFFLVTLAIGGVAWVFVYPILSGERNTERRKASVARAEPMAPRPTRTAQRSRREQVQGTLKEIDDRQKKVKRLPLAARISQAGLTWSKRRFFLTAGTLGFVAFFSVLAAGVGLLSALGAGFAAGCGLPLWLLSYLKKRRLARFLDGFPDAVDVIVRGIKAGLPLLDSLKLIADESEEPIRGEFRAIIETQAVGMPLGEACLRLYERMPVPEANFFGIVIFIQQRAGGNLSEALGNLSRVLRDRKKMKAKIQAMSMEAKASGTIIGALPFAVTTLVYITSPSYIEILFTEPLGHAMLAGCAIWMSIGVLVMRKMINFDF